MTIERKRERSAPVHVNTREQVVSLVYEVAALKAQFEERRLSAGVRITEPVAVHLIDDTGVQRLGFGASSMRPLVAIGAMFLLGPLQWALIGRRRQNRG
jgi:hypothetical protein